MIRSVLLACLMFPLASFAGILSVTTAGVPPGSNVNLTALGPVDWVHWGMNTEFGYDRKAGVFPSLSVMDPILSVNGSGPFQYSDNLNGYSWTDGVPNAFATNITTGIYVLAKGSGFQVTAPADTIVRRLRVFVGSFQAQCELDAALSDNSASAYSDSSVDNGTNGPATVYTLDYAADSPGQTIAVTFVVKNQHPNTDGNATLQAATLAYVVSNNPPTAAISGPPNNSTFTIPTNIPINASASDSDGTISKVEFFENNVKLGEVTNGYSLTWSNAPTGDYLLRAVATDNGGLSYTSSPVEIFISSGGGMLNGSFSVPPAAVDLTAEGSVDWAHWGLNLPTDFDHKSVVPQQISNAGVIGTNALQQSFGYPATFTWSDGTPSVNGSTANGAFVPFLTNGFELVVPAVSYTRTLKVYVGLFAGQGNLQAFLSDFSAPAYVDSSLNSLYDNASGVYTLSFSSPASNQTLHVRYTSQLLYDLQFGNVTLEAATLSGTAPPQPITLLNPAVEEDAFTFLFNSESNRNYAVEYNDSLDPGFWQTFTNFPGDGTMIFVGAPLGSGTQRFYRVRIQ